MRKKFIIKIIVVHNWQTIEFNINIKTYHRDISGKKTSWSILNVFFIFVNFHNEY